ncbi:MAG: type VI secretion system protein TssA [Pirellulaceae bacterium]
MATPEILDFARLLAPISDESPAGAELKEDSALRAVYQAVKDARESARAAEKKIMSARTVGEEPPAERPDWKNVYERATETISNHSKDLWIAAWLIESLARLHGFAGLRDGFRLTRELVNQYWDDIHPRPDEDGHATTVAQLTGLNGDESEGALIDPIYRIPVTVAGDGAALSIADHRSAVELDKLDPDRQAERLDRGAVSLQMFDASVRATPAEFFRTLLEDLQQAIDEFFQLSEALDTRCGSSVAPPTSAIRGALADVRDQVQTIAQSVLQSADAEAAVGGTGDATEGASGGEGGETAGATSGKGMNREVAFRQLLQVADFFSRTEPHSPVSYALRQAVRWGKMTLPEFLSELISDSGVRDDLFRRVGMPQPSEEESD